MKEITTEEAVEALRQAAWTTEPTVEEYEEAVSNVRKACVNHSAHGMVTTSSIHEALSVLRGRTVIHCFAGMFGADWDLDAAIKLTETATTIGWVRHFLGHDLMIVSGEKRYCFDCPMPGTERE